MTILISNLEDLLEDISDDEMQHVNGGTSAGCDVCSAQAEQSAFVVIPTSYNVGIGAGAAGLLAALDQQFPLAATYVRGIAQDPTTRRI
ncbi:MAG TPA: hypothetical protein V6C95_15850 [Coleofasciculaceae cyanobacterium]